MTYALFSEVIINDQPSTHSTDKILNANVMYHTGMPSIFKNTFKLFLNFL